MTLLRIYFFLSLFLMALGSGAQNNPGQTITLVLPENAHERIVFGSEKVVAALKKAGYEVTVKRSEKLPAVHGQLLAVGNRGDQLISSIANENYTPSGKIAKEGFMIRATDNLTVVYGADNSGTLYGCLELVERIQQQGSMPKKLSFSDGPQMVLRGECIGLQKPTYLPGRHVYEYPYTPETFPWFYDKALWIQVLDSMVMNRMNSLFLWNGHPFASLVKLKDYPYAVEVDEATFKKNEEMFGFLTREADRRGIWVIQMFYNIIVSKPFAEKHAIATQDRNRPIIPVIADYTRKSIAAFVEKYPNVGLMVALGEAMEGVGQDDITWFTQTIIPGVKDGLKALGKTDEPPIVLRAHDTDAPSVMEASLPLYKNLYTESKYNGEALTTYTPRGPWAEQHRKLASLGSIQIENVHILANLEPFRYGSPDFVQKSVQAMRKVHHGNGLHLYPQASYWDWPYSADNAPKRLLQIERDWIWYKTWSRYAWNADRPRNKEIDYWSSLLARKFGGTLQDGKHILTAYEETGEIAPKLLRRFGITDGNRQTLTLGMFMNQLINPYRYGLFTLLYNSEGPEGEMLTEYAEKEWKKQKHVGETPMQVINEVRVHGKKAVDAIDLASKNIRNNKDEFARIRNDVYIYDALANNFADKALAALSVLRYKYSNDIKDLEKAYDHLQKSLAHYVKLVALTKNSYLYANSMQTQQRKIPIGGNDGKHKTWEEMLPHYQLELANFRKNIDSLKAPKKTGTVIGKPVLKNAEVTLLTQPGGFYMVGTGQALFSDTATYIKDYTEELRELNALKLSKSKQITEGTSIRFTNKKPVKVLVGYFNHPDRRFLQPPQLEIDASANNYGQAEPKIRNAILVSGMPPVNIHTFTFQPGTNTLTLGKGAALVLGFVDDAVAFPVRDAALVPGSVKKELDWLFDHPVSPETLNLPPQGPLSNTTTEEKLWKYTRYFNSIDSEYAINHVPNAYAYEWLSKNIPLFECPDTTLEKIYYYRWWAVRKHLKQTPDGFVFTEFITPVNHAGKHNTVSSGLGHHINELRWLRDEKYLNDYITFWLHVDPKTPKPHLRAFSSWLQYALYQRYLVNKDKDFLRKNISVLHQDYKAWEADKKVSSGLFWQFDVRDAMEESISGSRKEQNRRPTINSYMYGNALAMAKIGELLGVDSIRATYYRKAENLRKLVHDSLWDSKESFFKVLHTNGQLDDAREAIGFIPWYFNLPHDEMRYAKQWDQLIDTTGFSAPWGLTTAERRHPLFRTHGSGHGCEWDGAVWPYATSQTLRGLSNLLTNYRYHSKMNRDLFYKELHKYAWSHQKNGLPYLGEYQDEKTGYWLKGDNPRSSYYNHSTFADLIISDLIGLKPREDNVLELNPLIPEGRWDWFLLEKVPYHGKLLTIRWDKDGRKYGKGAGLKIFADGKQIYSGKELRHLTVRF